MTSLPKIVFRCLALCLGVSGMVVSAGTSSADPVERTTITESFVTFNPCNEEQLLEIDDVVTFTEKDSYEGDSEHFLRQILQRGTVMNLTTGETYRLVSTTTNIFHWPDEVGDPPLIYIYRTHTRYVQPGSGMRLSYDRTIREIVTPDGTTVFEVDDSTLRCR
jgi:hypothetical protein